MSILNWFSKEERQKRLNKWEYELAEYLNLKRTLLRCKTLEEVDIAANEYLCCDFMLNNSSSRVASEYSIVREVEHRIQLGDQIIKGLKE